MVVKDWTLGTGNRHTRLRLITRRGRDTPRLHGLRTGLVMSSSFWQNVSFGVNGLKWDEMGKEWANIDSKLNGG
jgi:hypothetical protein